MTPRHLMGCACTECAAFPHTEGAGYDEGMPEQLLDSLDVFYGELTSARATVYARLEGLKDTDGLSLSGFVRGPRCYYATTLPTSFRLQDAGRGPSLLAKAVIPDPAYWSPDTPHIYDVTVELRRGSELIDRDERQIGFKPLGISGRHFTWEGKPWVLRGASNQTIDADDLSNWQDRSTSILFMNPPTDDQLEAASTKGVLCWLLMPILESTKTMRNAMWSLSAFPSVAGYLILSERHGDEVPRSLLECAPNVLKGLSFGDPTKVPTALRHRIFHQWKLEKDVPLQPELASDDYPLIIVREELVGRRNKSKPLESIESARAAADRLQADLAPYGQFAGYIV